MKKLFKGNVEQTKMSTDYIMSADHFDNYNKAVDTLIDRMESVMQQNPQFLEKAIECPPHECPHERLAQSLNIFQTYFGGERVNQIKELISENKKLAAVEREFQTNARRALRHMRRFYYDDYAWTNTERTKLEKAREHMDQMKHEVKQAKTTDQVEKKAALYEQAVIDFEAQANKVIALFSKVSEIQQKHHLDVREFYSVLGQFHSRMFTTIAKRD